MLLYLVQNDRFYPQVVEFTHQLECSREPFLRSRRIVPRTRPTQLVEGLDRLVVKLFDPGVSGYLPPPG